LFSLASLYVAAAIFGLGMGVYDLATGRGGRRATGVVLQTVSATLWGLTVPGYFIVLWPLAYANHAFLARVWNEDVG
jgi:hypothetical protein